MGDRALKYARIIATGSALPERVVTNADLEKLVETSDEWIRSRTGIRERRVAERRGDHRRAGLPGRGEGAGGGRA